MAKSNGNPFSPMAQYELPFTPLLPSQLLMGSPFQPGTPAMPQFAAGFPGTPPAQQQYFAQGFYELDTPSRTVYLGNIPCETTVDEVLNHVRSGIVENIKMVTEKNCAFVSFLDHASASHFHSDAILKKLTIDGQEIKIGWGRPSSLPSNISLAVSHEGASRNVYLGGLPDDITEEEIRQDLGRFGPIDTVKLIREKNIGFVHFLSIATAIKAVSQLPFEDQWKNRKVYYGKDRCAYISKTQQQNAAQYLGLSSGYEHLLIGNDRDMISTALAQQTAAAVAVAAAAGGAHNVGNRTVYLGNVHPETTIEEICNVVRGGLLHNIRYIPEKHICFVTFVDPTAAAQFFATATIQGLSIHNRRLKIGWGKHSGPLLQAVSLAVTAGASRNVYIGNIDPSWTENKLRRDFGDFGEVEQINFLPEKSCAFVNFTNITNAIKAIEGIKQKDEYKPFKINFGKDRCGNPPRISALHAAKPDGEEETNENDRLYGDQENEEEQGDDDNDKVENKSNDNNSHNNNSKNSNNINDNSNDYFNNEEYNLSPTFGPNSMLAQYLAQAQHEHYLYAAAMAEQARYNNQLPISGYDHKPESDSTTLSESSPSSPVCEPTPSVDSVATGDTMKKLKALKVENSNVYGLAIES